MACSQRCKEKYVPTVIAATALFFYCFGYSWLLNVLPQYYVDLACLSLANETYLECSSNASSPLWSNAATVANTQGSLLMTWLNVVAAVFCPTLCTLADSVGRKPILIVSTLFTSVFLVVAFAVPPSWFAAYSVYVAAVSGIGGSVYCYLALTFSVVADLTADATSKGRAVAFGVVESMCWGGLAVGPVAASFFVNALAPHKDTGGIQQVLVVGFAAQMAGLALVMFGLPETLAQKQRITWVGLKVLSCTAA